MLYYLFEYINKTFNPPGFEIFRFLTFRSCACGNYRIVSGILSWSKNYKAITSESNRRSKKKDGPKSHWSKAGTPTMGGMIIVLSVAIPVLLWGDIKSTYIILVLAGTIWLSARWIFR